MENSIPNLHPKPSQTENLQNVSIDFQNNRSTEHGFDKKYINLFDLFQKKINIKELTPLEDTELIKRKKK